MRRLASVRIPKWCCSFAVLATLLTFTACGGGGTSSDVSSGSSGGGGSGSGSSPDFSLSVSPSNVALVPTVSETFQISFSPSNGFTGNVQVAASGLPAGVTLEPSSPFMVSAAGMFVTINVSSTTTFGTYPIQLQAASGSLSHLATFILTVTQGIPGMVSFPPSRSGFLPLGQSPFAAAFDAVHQLVFASLPWLDLVAVVSTATNQVIKTIPVPGPEGLDLTLDDSKLMVGTTTGQLYAIDTAQLAVTGRTIVPVPIGASQPFQPQWPIVTANGTILIIATGRFSLSVCFPVRNPNSKNIDSTLGCWRWKYTTRAALSADGSKKCFCGFGVGGGRAYTMLRAIRSVRSSLRF